MGVDNRGEASPFASPLNSGPVQDPRTEISQQLPPWPACLLQDGAIAPPRAGFPSQ